MFYLLQGIAVLELLRFTLALFSFFSVISKIKKLAIHLDLFAHMRARFHALSITVHGARVLQLTQVLRSRPIIAGRLLVIVTNMLKIFYHNS